MLTSVLNSTTEKYNDAMQNLNTRIFTLPQQSIPPHYTNIRLLSEFTLCLRIQPQCPVVVTKSLILSGSLDFSEQYTISLTAIAHKKAIWLDAIKLKQCRGAKLTTHIHIVQILRIHKYSPICVHVICLRRVCSGLSIYLWRYSSLLELGFSIS